ncbi:MAG: hypothetical protein RI945_399 [Candidatus Parcubacteria bacterium]|jgi:predicted RND superfamily exporter protein
MNKHLSSFHELHHTHKMTHKVLSLILFTILVVLAVYGLSRVKAEQAMYAHVPNGNTGICYRIDTDFNNSANHVSCKTYNKVCQTQLGTLVECDTGRMVVEKPAH